MFAYGYPEAVVHRRAVGLTSTRLRSCQLNLPVRQVTFLRVVFGSLPPQILRPVIAGLETRVVYNIFFS